MGKKKKAKYTPSSGCKATRDRQQRIRRLRMKIRRWDKYRERGKSVSKNNKKMSRYKEWDTSGLKKQIAFLEKIL